ncbi:SDR family NAD(P)-dependent oxidoreductase [Mycolicibacterium fortuitum]|uniref:SDR family NAD(P)-dependent oxidoreductase n=1 Tax=Mycolicibacterium fortuitum TaxID=1766 RepID=UPI001AEF8D76|nr:SDR family oxidoreductase [Mycolicibacterium fortuitum]MBP3083807.1 SDR family oxidoreductase [Mycolicibacterium fortuitum]
MKWPNEKAAFVTGAASGIGLGIARALVNQGAKVALADLDADKLTSVAEQFTSTGATVAAVPLDVSSEDQWLDAADRAEAALGSVSILVNNAGIVSNASIVETTSEVWHRHFRVNVDGQFFGIKTFLPRFLKRGGRAHILNTASMGALMPIPGVAAYCASKFASMGLSLTLREELKTSAVDVSVLTPGTVATGLTTAEATNDRPAGADPDRVGEQVVEALQAQRFLIPTHGDYQPILAGLHREIEQAFADTDDRHGPDPSLQMILAGTDPLEEILRREPTH